jgi:hypothetical protein
MRYERLKKSPSWSPTSSPTTSKSLDKSRPFPLQAKPHSELSPNQEDIENEAFQQHKHEATGLEVQAEYGTLTPEGQQRLTVLQAKMADFWQKKESSQASGINLLEIPNLFAPRQPLAAQPIQPKLTIGEPGDKYEQEADQMAAQVVNQINAPQKQPSSQGGTLQREEMAVEDEKLAQIKPWVQQGAGQAFLQRKVTDHKEEDASITYRHPQDPEERAVTVNVKRPKKVVGKIEENKRGPTPDPLVVTSLSREYHQLRKLDPSIRKVKDEIMFGGTYDRGHMMAAELGGADEEWNIVPQWSLNQQSGPWRELEKEAPKKAKEIEVTAHYAADSGSWRKVGVPTHMTYELKKANQSIQSTDWDNAPDENDLVVTSEVVAALSQKEAIHKFLKDQGQTLSVQQILSGVMQEARELSQEHIDYRNKQGRAKTKKKSLSKKELEEKILQIIKEMILQGELQTQEAVNYKTKKDKIKGFKQVGLGQSSMFDSTDEEIGSDEEMEFSDMGSDSEDEIDDLNKISKDDKVAIASHAPGRQGVSRVSSQPNNQIVKQIDRMEFDNLYLVPSDSVGLGTHIQFGQAIIMVDTSNIRNGYANVKILNCQYFREYSGSEAFWISQQQFNNGRKIGSQTFFA